MNVLGVSAHYHDSAATLLVDGELVAAVEEERLTRHKHDASFPWRAIDAVLDEAGLRPRDIDVVGWYELPGLKRDRIRASAATSGVSSRVVRRVLRSKPSSTRQLARSFVGFGPRTRLVAIEHHASHAASAYYPSPFDDAAILTLDGVGEVTTTSIGRGRGKELELCRSISFPHSLGLLYSAITAYCGFRVNSGEYKLMGLAPYGSPVFRTTILDRLVTVGDDGSFAVNQSLVGFADPTRATLVAPAFADLFGAPPRDPDGPLDQVYADVAASMQAVFEEIVLRMAAHAKAVTGAPNLCMAGGAALNCVANARLRASDLFEDVWVQPSAGDSGGSLGVAFYVWHAVLGRPRPRPVIDAMRGSYLGPSFSDAEVREFLDAIDARYAWHHDDDLFDVVAERLATGEVVGWFQGRMEFGPRALGNRSILGDPRDPTMKDRLNEKVKLREGFRPFAPAALLDRVGVHFGDDRPSPYMSFVSAVSDDQLPAVTHVDRSARLQTVDRAQNARFERLLRAFDRRTGCPVLVNTSLNVRGEPIACSPSDAVTTFLRSGLDCIVLGNHVLERDQPDLVLTAPATGSTD